MQPKKLTGPSIFHLELSEGMDHFFRFQYIDESTLLPVDLTGWAAYLCVKRTPGNPQILKGIGSSQETSEGRISLTRDGFVEVHILPEFTSQIYWQDAFYDLVLVDPDLKRTKLLRGKVNVYNTLSYPQGGVTGGVSEEMVLTVGKTSLPSGTELFGYMNPVKMGLGAGLLLTGELRPFTYQDVEIAELSYAGGRIQLTFVGNVQEGTFTSISLGYSKLNFADSSGRVFNPSAVGGKGITYWEWAGVPSNPLQNLVGQSVLVRLETAPV